MFFVPSMSIVLVHLLLFVVALFMGTLILVHDQKSATNQIFALMAVTIIGWDIANFLSLSFIDAYYQMLSIRFLMACVSLLISLVVIFALVYPKKDRGSTVLKRTLLDVCIGLFCWVGYFVFADPDLSTIATTLDVKFTSGILSLGGMDIPLLPLWGIASMILSVLAAGILFMKMFKATGDEKEGQMTVLLSVGLTFILLPLLLFLPPALFKNNMFVPFSPLAYIPMFFGIGYAIARHRVFNVRIVYAEALVFAMMFIMFVFIFT
jgi:hypothetical protein